VNTKIDELFATLRGLIADQTRDLKMAMAELANVAKERDSFKSGRADLAAVLATYSAERDKLKAERDSANWSLSRAKESLRAAEQEVVEVEGASFDLRTVNARLVADLAAAMQRADTAEAILRAKA
jgi:chromosome segregation ATPase